MKSIWDIVPLCDASEAFVEHYQRRACRRIAYTSDGQLCSADLEEFVHQTCVVDSLIICRFADTVLVMAFTPIIGTLIYLLDRNSKRVLLIRRDARPADDHYGKFNGLGGKLELDESVAFGARREVQEEAGIAMTSLILRGTVSWSNFGPKREEWLGFIFLSDEWEGEPLSANEEGSLVWIELKRLLDACNQNSAVRAAANLPMWAGDRHFVPLVFDDDPRQFHGAMPYDNERPLNWSFERI
jgi:8-oxo-dGTP diphosphatase